MLATCLTAAAAAGQSTPAKPALALDRFQPTLSPGGPGGPDELLMTPSARTIELGGVAVGLRVDEAIVPLRINGAVGSSEAAVSQQATGQLLAAFGLGRVQLGLALPMTLYQSTSLAPPVALGDLRLHGKARLSPRRFWGVAVDLTATLPTGRGDHFSGEPGVTLSGRLIGDLAVGRFSAAVYFGYRARSQSIHYYSIYVNDELLAGLGASYALLPNRLSLFGEAWGSFGLRGDPWLPGSHAQIEAMPVEALVGARLKLDPTVDVALAAGPGLTGGYGTPAFRVIFALTYVRFDRDSDGDGIPNALDRCPFAAEDKDGFEDGDGCPDPDNDHDGVLDTADQCPGEREDRDGFKDDDGCIDPDNDADGIPDVRDKCPNQAEDRDGYQDEDGCPDLDNDHDGIPDTVDKCPNEPEDRDGFQDDDGCYDAEAPPPAPAPPEKATKRAPRAAPQLSKGLDDKIYFDVDSDALMPWTEELLLSIADVINLHPEYERIVVAGYADDPGSAARNRLLALQRAMAVKIFLIQQGQVKPYRLVAKSYGMMGKAGSGNHHGENRRVQFQILEKRKLPTAKPAKEKHPPKHHQ